MVTCYEGLVRVDRAGSSVELPAGNAYRLVGGRATTTEIAGETAPSWTRNESSFQSMPVSRSASRKSC